MLIKRKRDEKKRQLYLLLAVALPALVLLLVAVAVVTEWVSRPGSVLYSGDLRLMYNSDGYRQAINLTTGEATQIGTADRFIRRSATSPDGTWYAAWSMVTQWTTWELTLTNQNTGEEHIFGPYEIASPTVSWSPDSRWLAFAIGNEKIGLMEGSELFLLKVENGALKQLTNNGYRDDAPDFSPDGTRLVFTSSEDGYNRLYIMELDTLSRRVLTPDIFGYQPVWSPDGSLIAFMSDQDGWRGDIYVIAPDGTGQQRLTDFRTDDTLPIWLR